MSEAFSAESVDSISDSNGQGCKSNGSARSTPTAEPCCGTTGLTRPATRTFTTSTEAQNELISSVEDSPANPSASPAKDSRKKTRAGSGPSSPELLATFDPDTSLWKTSPDSSDEDSILSSRNWPRWGMTRSGKLFRRQRVVPRTLESASSLWRIPHGTGYWPTPVASVAQLGEKPRTWLARRERLKVTAKNGNGAGMPLTIAVQMWPTPRASDGTGAGQRWKKRASSRDNLAERVVRLGEPSGSLNPTWVAWLMGFPIEWLSCVPWETLSSRKSQKQSGA